MWVPFSHLFPLECILKAFPACSVSINPHNNSPPEFLDPPDDTPHGWENKNACETFNAMAWYGALARCVRSKQSPFPSLRSTEGKSPPVTRPGIIYHTSSVKHGKILLPSSPSPPRLAKLAGLLQRGFNTKMPGSPKRRIPPIFHYHPPRYRFELNA